MYIYGSIGFRPIDMGDIECLRGLHNEMTTLLQLGSVEMFSSEEQLEWWKQISKSKTSKLCSIIDTESQDIIGIIRIQNIDSINRNCEIGLDIVPKYRGKGLGAKSYAMLMQYLFLQFNMHMIYLRVGAFNDHAKAIYEELHFIETGRYKDYLYRHGQYWDYILMTMTKDHYISNYQESDSKPGSPES